MGAISDWAAYAREVTRNVEPPPPEPDDPPVDLKKINTDYEANNGEMEKTRHEIEGLGDKDPNYLEKLNKYQDLVDKQTKLLAQLEKLKKDGPPQGTDKAGFDKQVKDLEQKLGASIHGDQDGVADGGHDLGQGRYLTRVGDNDGNSEGGSIESTAHTLFGDAADEGRSLALNGNKFDANSADWDGQGNGSMNTAGRAKGANGKTLRDADLVHDNDFVVVAVKPEVVQQAQQSGQIPTKVDPAVKTHATDVTQKHVSDPNYAQYSAGMDDLLLKLSQTNLTPDQQKDAIDRYDRMVAKLPKSDDPKVQAKTEDDLRKNLASPEFQKLDGDTKNKYEELYIKYASDPKKLEGLNKLVKDAGYQASDAPKQKEMLEKYDSDSRFRDVADKIANDPNLTPAERKAALDYLRGTTNRRDYKDADDKGKTTIMNNVYKVVTSDVFKKGDDALHKKIMDYMFADTQIVGSNSYAKMDDGAAKVLEYGPKANWHHS